MHLPTFSFLISLILGMALLAYVIKSDLKKKPRELKEALWDYYFLILVLVVYTLEAFGISWFIALVICILLGYNKDAIRAFIEKNLK